MPRYIDANKVKEQIASFVGMFTADGSFMIDYNAVLSAIDNAEPVDVVPRAEVEKMQECIYDLYVMLDGVIEKAKMHDLSMLRPFRGASGCDAYQGLPPICRRFDELFDKHIETIHCATKLAELKKKYTGGE